MKIYPETLANLAHCTEWISTPSIAKQRRRLTNGINKSISSLLKYGLIERRVIGKQKSRPDKSWWYEYKITEAGLRVLYPAMHIESEQLPTDPIVNAFHWETFVQPASRDLYEPLKESNRYGEARV